ncbi:MAG: LysR family transcriptional regulator [Pseudomonadota bacterium]
MELRHLRYFIAVAEAGSLKLAAETRLHTAQPSLSRQIRDLEYEVGVPLMTRSVQGIRVDRRRPRLSRPCAAVAHPG